MNNNHHLTEQQVKARQEMANVYVDRKIFVFSIFFIVEMWLSLNQEKMSGILNIHGLIHFFHAVMI
jgi:hypothetical protein